MHENRHLATVPDFALPVPSQTWQAARPFVNGGLSGMAAWMFVQPADIVKVRIQLGIVKSPVGHCPCKLKKHPSDLSETCIATSRISCYNHALIEAVFSEEADILEHAHYPQACQLTL